MVEIVPAEWRGPMLAYSRALLVARLSAGTPVKGAARSGGGRRSVREDPRLPEAAEAPFLAERYGVFVTLRRHGELRGCIGRITGDEPLAKTLPRITLEAALQDRRFLPLTAEEVPEVTIEHSILTHPEPVETYQAIVPGRHGIILTLQGRRALFLPEVATEQRWDLPQTLSHLAWKAGLSRDAWLSPECRFQVFETQHYGEGDA